MHSPMHSSTNKNISFKNIGVVRGCLLLPTYSNSEDKVRVFAIKRLYIILFKIFDSYFCNILLKIKSS